MEVAFVDGQGNIATARLDGTGVRVLTAPDPEVRRAQPTFEDGGSEIVFSERGHDGVWRLKEVAADGHDDLASGKADPTVEETQADRGDDTAPSATWFQASHGTTAHSELVFEHRTPGGKLQVYIADRNQRGFGASRFVAGRAPAVSPTGDRVAFIADGQIRVMRLASDRRHSTQVTWGAHPVGHLAWSADGCRIAFSSDRDVESVASTPAVVGHNPAHIVRRYPGVASYGTLRRPVVGTYAGGDAVSRALAVSRAHFASGDDIAMDETSGYGVTWTDHVTLVGTSDPAAAAAADAVAHGGALLFTRGATLQPAVRDEIVRLLHRPHGFGTRVTVDVVGTPGDVPDSVLAALHALRPLVPHLRVRRIDPADPAGAAAGAVEGSSSIYVVASQDDLTAIASSAGGGSPLLLTEGSTMPVAAARRLNHIWHEPGTPATVYAVGAAAQAAVRSPWPGKKAFQIVDIGGVDTTSTSLAAVQGLYDAPGRLVVTAADDWRDQLIGGMVGPTLVVDGSLSPDARSWLEASQPVMRAVYLLGAATDQTAAMGQAVYGERYRVVPSPRDITQ
jgi:hypothetical protein